MATSMISSEATLSEIESCDQIRKFDENEGLSLYCYVSCTREDSELVKQTRGAVYYQDKLLVRGYGFTPEFTPTTYTDELNNVDFNTCRFFASFEGSLIRVFYGPSGTSDEGRWYISTHKKLDAYKSKWSSQRSFGLMFEHALTNYYQNNQSFRQHLENEACNEDTILGKFLESLDNQKQYMFLVTNTSENRIVCDAGDEPRIIHVGTFDRNHRLLLDENVHIPTPPEWKFNNCRQLFMSVENMNPFELQGVVVVCENGDMFKCLNDQYKFFHGIRGNESSIKYRYLQVRMNKEEREALCYLYPTYQSMFDKYEDTIYNIANYITQSYKKRYIYKEHVVVPTEEFSIMKKCHEWYLSDRTANRISFQKVMNMLNDQPPSFLNKMVRRFISDENEKHDTDIDQDN